MAWGLQAGLISSTQSPNGGSAGLTGLVYNSSASFVLPTGGPATYPFSNSGWIDFRLEPPAQGTMAVQVVAGRPANPAKYRRNIGVFMGHTYLYAANHQTGAIDVYDTSFTKVSARRWDLR